MDVMIEDKALQEHPLPDYPVQIMTDGVSDMLAFVFPPLTAHGQNAYMSYGLALSVCEARGLDAVPGELFDSVKVG